MHRYNACYARKQGLGEPENGGKVKFAVETVEFFTVFSDSELPIFSSVLHTILSVAETNGRAAVRLSIESYLLVNLLMDTLLLTLALRAVGQPVTVRVLLATLLGVAYALACAICPSRWLHSAAAQGCVMLAMLLVASGRAGDKPRLIAAMALETLLMGGLLDYACRATSALAPFLAAVAAGGVLIALTQDRRRMGLDGLTVCVCVRHGGRTARFTALIDTGNRLREPFSGLPVLIAESRLVADLLPADLPLRRIPYGGLGGSGFLEAFRPETLHFSGTQGWQRAPEVWIALYPGRMSGQIHALAPPAFALRDPKIMH